jgi:hypothetical protein
MSLFKGKYLRVSTPCTTDGASPKLDEEGKLEMKETFLPVSAKKDLELQNKILPEILRKKIEIVTDDEPVTSKDVKNTVKK